MALRTGCIKAIPKIDGYFRISVMSRHTLNDGVTPDPEITESSRDEWWPELAPPDTLIGWYYKQQKKKLLPHWKLWENFERKFTHYLQDPDVKIYLQHLATLARYGDVIILCIEPTPKYCHRRLVAEACRRVDPSLAIIIE
jgi:uncharacterized protein YeaO (DUF488 family)